MTSREIEARIRALILEAADIERVIEDPETGRELRGIAEAARAELIEEAADLRRRSRECQTRI